MSFFLVDKIMKKSEKKLSCGYKKCNNGYVHYMGTDYVCEACVLLNKKAKQKNAIKLYVRFAENFDANLF